MTAPARSLAPGPSAPANPAPPVVTDAMLVGVARRVSETRQLFPPGVLRDAAWDMLLRLFIANHDGETLCVKDLTLLCNESPAGGVRRIDRLQDAQLVVRRTDRQDHRRIVVGLTEAGRSAMREMLKAMLVVIDERSPTSRGARMR